MKLTHRRILGLVIAILIVAAGIVFAFVGGLFFSAFLAYVIPPKTGQNINPKVHVETFWQLAFLGFAVTAGFAAILLCWERRLAPRRQTILFCTFLALLLPVSAVDFATGDALMHRWTQAIIDACLIFLGLFATSVLSRWRPSSESARVFQSVVFFGLFFEAVMLPAAFLIIWALDAQGVPLAVSKEAVAIVTGIVSLGVSAHKHVQQLRDPPQEQPGRVILP